MMAHFLWLLYLFFPLVALGLGWAKWEWGPRAFQDPWGIKAIFLALSFGISTHFVLVRPLVQWVWNRAENVSRFKLISISSILISLPMITFGYWLGDVKTVLQAQEVTLIVVPAVVLSTLVYDKTRQIYYWSAALAVMAFFYFFIINEILNPFQTYLYLLTEDYRYEYLRIVFPALVIGLYYRVNYEPAARAYLGINAIHHSWKSSRFSQMFKSTNPRKSSFESQPESRMGD